MANYIKYQMTASPNEPNAYIICDVVYYNENKFDIFVQRIIPNKY